MSPKIVIIGSTGKLGEKLINFLSKKKIKVFGATCYKNLPKLENYKKKIVIQNIFNLYDNIDKVKFLNFLKKNIDLIYFLDFGSKSLLYLNQLIKFNAYTKIAIANKEMLIAGGSILRQSIIKSNNELIPLDSEHFSLIHSSINKENINKIYITASGGPFYFKKNKKLNDISLNEAINHPKWKMGINNSIDSSNFINKLLEIYELHHIFNIPLYKINFLISKEAFIHSIIEYKSGILTFNSFKNDMMIPLVYPLRSYMEVGEIKSFSNIFNDEKLRLFKAFDKRFKIFKYLDFFKGLNHKQQIDLMIFNNIAQKKFINKSLKYNNIISFIYKNLFKKKNDTIKLNSFVKIIKYIENFKIYED